MAWLAIVTLTLGAASGLLEMLTPNKVTIRLEVPIYLWAAWFIYAHM